MEILKAIAEIRKRLDEIEELAKALPSSEEKQWFNPKTAWRMTNTMRDWMDSIGIEKKDRVRSGLLRVAMLAEEGLTADQIKQHRLVKRKTATHEHIDDFLAKWSARDVK